MCVMGLAVFVFRFGKECRSYYAVYPVDARCLGGVVLASSRRRYVESTLMQRCFGVVCPPGTLVQYLSWAIVYSKIFSNFALYSILCRVRTGCYHVDGVRGRYGIIRA